MIIDPKDYFSSVEDAITWISSKDVKRAVDILQAAREAMARVWIVGNGGSAALASHFANDLLKMGGVDATALTDAMPTVSAFGNDTGWENMFFGPLELLFSPGDVLVAISCSGKSKNVLNAAARIAAMGGILIVLTGNSEGNLLVRHTRSRVDVALFVDSNDIRVQEDCHAIICHAIAGMLASTKV